MSVDRPKYYIKDFKDFDWQVAKPEDIVNFAKTLDFPEPGIAYSEAFCLLNALEAAGTKPLTILETGMGWGTTTRIFLAWVLKHGGKLYSCEVHLRQGLLDKLAEADVREKLNVVEGDSQAVAWDKAIDFLMIDSEHSLADALGEYLRFRKFLRDGSIVGFHDTTLPGVKRALEIIPEVDTLEYLFGEEQAVFGIRFYRLLHKNRTQHG